MSRPRRRLRLRILLLLGAALLLGAGGYLYTQYVPPILMYHRVDGTSARTALSVSPESFARQMAFLHDRGVRVVPLDAIVDWIVNDRPPVRGAVAITFDDGFENVYTNAYPVLRRYGMPATVFIVTDWVGQPGYLTWDQIRELAANGVAIGSHTISHPWLPAVNDERLRAEVVESQRLLQERVPGAARHFSYPFGAYDGVVKHTVRAAGYVSACATNPGRHRSWRDRYALKRLRISRSSDNLFVFWIESSGYYTWIKEHRGKHLWRPRPLETMPHGEET